MQEVCGMGSGIVVSGFLGLVLVVQTAITCMIKVYGKCGAHVNSNGNYHVRLSSSTCILCTVASQSLPIVLASI